MADFGYVKQAGITPARPYATRRQTDLIILHHASGRAAMTDDEAAELVRTYHRVHVGKGNRGIDYNFLVAGNGSVYDGRGLEYEGGHVLNGGASAGMNARSVGICALGDFEHNEMPEAQKEGLKRIVRDVAQHYGVTEIIRHKQVKNTDCPGKNYPFDEIVAYALGGDAPQPTPTPEPQPTPQPDSGWAVNHTLYRPCHVQVNNYMNFRTGPGEDHAVIRQLHNGDKLALLENRGDWLRVCYIDTNEVGYVFGEWIISDNMMRGEDVRGLQMAINRHTGLGIVEDAALGDNTAYGIVQLQKTLGIQEDGQAGRNTVTASGGRFE